MRSSTKLNSVSEKEEPCEQTQQHGFKLMALLGLFLVLFAFLLEPFNAEKTPSTLDPQDASFCHGGLEAIYPELDIDKCLVIPKDHKFREKISSVWKAPQIYFSRARKEKMYVLVMVDPDAPRRSQHASYWRHWLVVNIKGSSLEKGEMRGITLTDYHPPTPPQKTGFHRYQFMLFEQPPHTEISLAEQESSRGKWDLHAFIARLHLGEPVAALQFLTQNFKD
ncbi:phosphatidylethanolamine-binding protein 4 [Fundulus heteroclitus]|uniref:phosphatidylethanolamine-binding protein 4 n=1 Tax=Fundulus heteroclitus TaxID=8078 RepID=UPI00165A3B25|nr:phosphatidylethanolamine-binding protein 4 [Fundulus heteroclitus]